MLANTQKKQLYIFPLILSCICTEKRWHIGPNSLKSYIIAFKRVFVANTNIHGGLLLGMYHSALAFCFVRTYLDPVPVRSTWYLLGSRVLHTILQKSSSL
jgi:hypothetical protein